MTKIINVTQEGGQTAPEKINRPPNRCPLCHTTIVPQFVIAIYKPANEGLMAVYRCVQEDCGRLFIGHYSQRIPRQSFKSLQRVEPCNPEPIVVPDEVAEISPMYVKIREQANEAEAAGLDEIVGIGLRKALEFLVKDYAKHQDSGGTKHDEIEKAFLGTVIKTYIKDERIKQCAKRAAWLGNDHAHYLVKWEDNDIDDLKSILHLTVNWIDSVLVSDKLLLDMPDKET